MGRRRKGGEGWLESRGGRGRGGRDGWRVEEGEGEGEREGRGWEETGTNARSRAQRRQGAWEVEEGGSDKKIKILRQRPKKIGHCLK
jgi:hypothetical protein